MAKQANRAIILKYDEDFFIKFNGKIFKLKYKYDDTFIKEELEILKSKMNGEYEEYCVNKFKEGILLDSFRIAFNSIKCEYIRNKPRLFLHITIDGKALPKKDKYGNNRHNFSKKSKIGLDLGIQSGAIVSKDKIDLFNLSEGTRGNILNDERTIYLLQRKMDRSRRSTNPNNYNENGTIKKGKRTWVKSKNYKKLEKRYKELCRKERLSRLYANKELASNIRTLGSVLVTEKDLVKAWAKRGKGGINDKGKQKRKKRFGKSIQKRSPGKFIEELKTKFDTYIEVDNNYRASQYDHELNDYIKKKLSQRWHIFKDGTKVQRDLYSAFLLYNTNDDFTSPDLEKCINNFNVFYIKELILVDNIKKE